MNISNWNGADAVEFGDVLHYQCVDEQYKLGRKDRPNKDQDLFEVVNVTCGWYNDYSPDIRDYECQGN